MTEATKGLIVRVAIIIVAVVAVYSSTLNHGFIRDDASVIVENPQLRSLTNLPAVFLNGGGSETSVGSYAPMAYLSFALEHALWGLNPLGYDVTSLVLHSAVAILLFLLVSTLFGSERLGLVT